MTGRIREQKLPKLVLLLAVLGLSVMFTVYSDSIAEYAMNAMKLCAISVIPSLFPFMVLSSLASKAASHFTHSSSPIAAVILSYSLGALCGFPIGAAAVTAMYKNGALKKNFAEELCALCNNTGPAFVIGVIGRGFWNNTQIGVMFYVCQLSASALVFGIWRSIFRARRNCQCFAPAEKSFRRAPTSHKAYSANAAERFAGIFCTSVSSSAISVLQICGYIVFFKVICETVRYFLPHSPVCDLIYTATASVLEFTSGASTAAKLGGIAGVAFCGFTVGFSGLSVIGQSTGILSAAGLSSLPMVKMKLLTGIFSATLSAVSYLLFDFSKSAFIVTHEALPCSMIRISSVIIAFFAVLKLFLTFRHSHV